MSSLERKLRRAFKRKKGIGVPEVDPALPRRERRFRRSQRIVAPGLARQGERVGRQLTKRLQRGGAQAKATFAAYMELLDARRDPLLSALIMDPKVVEAALDD